MDIATQLGWTVVWLSPLSCGIRHRLPLRDCGGPALQASPVGQGDLFFGHLAVPCLSALVRAWS